MFAVVYRSWVFPDKEDKYKKLWQQIATYFVSERGAIGACLHKTNEGYYLAYSRWPDRGTRDASWPGDKDRFELLPTNIAQIITDIRSYINTLMPFPEITMDVACDLLLPLKSL